MSLHRLLLWVSNSTLFSVQEHCFMSCDQCGAGSRNRVRAQTMPRLFLCLVSCCFVRIHFYCCPLWVFAHSNLLFSYLPCHIVPFSTPPVLSAAFRPYWHVISYSILLQTGLQTQQTHVQEVASLYPEWCRASANLSPSDGHSQEGVGVLHQHLLWLFCFYFNFNYFCLGKLFVIFFIILKLVKLAQCWKKKTCSNRSSAFISISFSWHAGFDYGK